MKKETKKVPTIRFKEFTDDWEQRKLKELVEFNPSEELPDEFEYVDLESVVGTEMISHRHENKATAPSRAQRVACQGDLFYQTVRPYQKNNYLFDKPDNDYVFSTGYAQMRPYIDGHFLLDLVQTERFVKIVLDNCTGTSYPAINANDLSSIKITYPQCRNEQQTIGVFLASIDNLITLHQRKLKQLQALKKYFLQNMFPAKEEKVPAIRFKGFTGDWEQKKITDISKIFIGLVTTMTENYRDQGTLLIRNSDIRENQFSFSNTPIFLKETFAEENKTRRLKLGDVITVHTGDIGTSAIITKNEVGAIGFATINTRPNKEILDSYYLAAFFNTKQHKTYALRMATGDGRSNYNLKDFKKLVIPLPSIAEQKKIGGCFQNLYHLIIFQQHKINQLQSLKKFMLQNLFI